MIKVFNAANEFSILMEEKGYEGATISFGSFKCGIRENLHQYIDAILIGDAPSFKEGFRIEYEKWNDDVDEGASFKISVKYLNGKFEVHQLDMMAFDKNLNSIRETTIGGLTTKTIPLVSEAMKTLAQEKKPELKKRKGLKH